ncbi:uncharacterized protein A4U43_C07F7500 [Asparagus officinalis]|uniref:Uncharacterized protein n=1 Tax=Asparagus officinalis TaxID=4686 RepID=A0A5P1EC01_ASPOF|nr:uncharacterized protein A4U43_C07F7500 [Asparagus officinalis]
MLSPSSRNLTPTIATKTSTTITEPNLSQCLSLDHQHLPSKSVGAAHSQATEHPASSAPPSEYQHRLSSAIARTAPTCLQSILANRRPPSQDRLPHHASHPLIHPTNHRQPALQPPASGVLQPLAPSGTTFLDSSAP